MVKNIFFLSIVLLLLTIGIVFMYPLSQKNTTDALKQTSSAPEKNTKTLPISSGKIPDIPLRISSDFMIHVFAQDLGRARDLIFSPKGTLLVSNIQTNQIIALPDKNQDGTADRQSIVIDDLPNVHGIAFFQNTLFVATTTEVVRYRWDEEKLQATKEKTLFSLPQNNNHKYRTIVFDKKGNMYVSVGSTCNVCNEASPQSATVLISNANGDTPRIFAKGLRNAPFLTTHPQTDAIWATEMGRDHLGDDTPPDEINILSDGKNYGWPLCYGKKIHDTNFDRKQYARNPCEDTVAPIFEIPAHSAPLGLTFITSKQFPTEWQNDLLVAYHGSWNRSKPIGYKIVHLKVSGNTIVSSEDFLTGFISDNALVGSQADGRPVDLVFDAQGNLYVSDDKAGMVYIIQKKT